ncbi:MAG: lipid-binding SYLF domain-containing protein [Verrucomicrobia bacterium]|nr:lipid-binding SYLF domain-containing protein [Verrucomicrobiota bacterium]
MHKTLAVTLGLFLVTLVPAPAASTLAESIDKTIEILHQYGESQGDSIPRNVFHECKGLVILSIYKAAFIIGASGGEGLVVMRTADGKWSPPSAISAAGAGVGFQAGVSNQDFVMLLNTEEAVRQFEQKGNYTSSAECEGTAGPVGRELSAGVATVNAPIYTYSFSKGLFGGVSLSGRGLASADDTNENFYGERLNPREILAGKIKKTPEAVKQLWKALEELDKKPKIEGKTPSKNAKGSTKTTN